MFTSHRHHNNLCQIIIEKCCFESRCKTTIFCLELIVFVSFLVIYLIYLGIVFGNSYSSENYSYNENIDSYEGNLLIYGLALLLLLLSFLGCYGYCRKKEYQKFVAVEEYPTYYASRHISEKVEQV